MGRGGRSGGGSRPAATSAPRASPFARSAPAPAAPAPRAATAPQAKPQTTPPPQTPAPSGGGGGFLSTLAASAAGSMVGNVVANKMFGNSNDAPQSLPPQSTQAIDAEMGPCAVPFKSFLKCTEQSETNIQACQWSYQMFAECRRNPSAFSS